ncbi:MAG: biotin--[acetyl-CoA-carboxylase] ligase [Rhodothermales bacterium]
MLQPHVPDSPSDAWDALDRCRWMGTPRRIYESIDSTNIAASAWARGGAPNGAIVIADYQTAGRGRHQRAWQAEPGKNLLFSLILRPVLPLERVSVLPLLAGLAAARAIDGFASPVVVSLKWPNDVYIDGKKCGGMLLESSQSGGLQQPPEFIVLGIGINVNQASFPDPIASSATSLVLETGRFVARDALLAHLLIELETMYDQMGNDDALARLLGEYESRMYRFGEQVDVRVAGGGAGYRGFIEGVSPGGALQLRTEEGVVSLHAGEVTLRPLPHA